MEKQRCGQSTGENVSLHTQRPRKRCGASNGFPRQGKMKDLPQLEPTKAFRSTEKPQAVEAGETILVVANESA